MSMIVKYFAEQEVMFILAYIFFLRSVSRVTKKWLNFQELKVLGRGDRGTVNSRLHLANDLYLCSDINRAIDFGYLESSVLCKGLQSVVMMYSYLHLQPSLVQTLSWVCHWPCAKLELLKR